MKVVRVKGGIAEIELTRRNLRTLLLKLDAAGGEQSSACTITKHDSGGAAIIRAVEDDEHYADRPAGPMLDPVTGEVF